MQSEPTATETKEKQDPANEIHLTNNQKAWRQIVKDIG